MKSLEIRRPMMRCRACRRWWSGPPENAAAGDDRKGQPIAPNDPPPRCGCGGELAHADMDEHMKSLPYAPHDPKAGSPPKPES